MSNVTTSKNGIRVEDITFKGARRQSEIEKEIGADDSVSENVVVPVSLTPEQVKTFFDTKSQNTLNMQEKKVYQQTIRWIDELFETKKKLVALQMKEEVREKVAKEENTGV